MARMKNWGEKMVTIKNLPLLVLVSWLIIALQPLKVLYHIQRCYASAVRDVMLTKVKVSQDSLGILYDYRGYAGDGKVYRMTKQSFMTFFKSTETSSIKVLGSHEVTSLFNSFDFYWLWINLLFILFCLVIYYGRKKKLVFKKTVYLGTLLLILIGGSFVLSPNNQESFRYYLSCKNNTGSSVLVRITDRSISNSFSSNGGNLGTDYSIEGEFSLSPDKKVSIKKEIQKSLYDRIAINEWYSFNLSPGFKSGLISPNESTFFILINMVAKTIVEKGVLLLLGIISLIQLIIQPERKRIEDEKNEEERLREKEKRKLKRQEKVKNDPFYKKKRKK